MAVIVYTLDFFPAYFSSLALFNFADQKELIILEYEGL